MKVSNQTIAKFKKRYGLKNIDYLSVEQYKMLLQMEADNEVNTIDKIHYVYNARYITPNSIEVSLSGRHLSRNRINALGRRDTIKLKKKIKDAAKLFFLQNNRFVRPKWDKVQIEYAIHLKRMRDDDNNDLKPFQDTFVIHSLIKDDNSMVIIGKPKETQILSDTYKICAIIKKVEHEHNLLQ